MTASLFAAFAVGFLLAGFVQRCIRCANYPLWYMRYPAVHVFTVDNTMRVGLKARVLVNGVEVNRCFRADVLTGTADCYVERDGQLQISPDGQSVLTERLYGRVDMVLSSSFDE